MHPVLIELVDRLKESAPATAAEITHDGDDELITLGPSTQGATRVELREHQGWMFLSFSGLSGGLELDLVDPRDHDDLARIFTAVATGTATLGLRTLDYGRRFARVTMPDGRVLRADVGFGDVFWRRESVQCSPWTVP